MNKNTERGKAGDSPKYSDTVLYVVCFILLISILLFDLVHPLGVGIGSLYITVIFLSLWLPHDKATVIFAIIVSTLIIAGFFFKPQVAEMWKATYNRVIALFTVWVIALLGMKRKQLEKQQNKILFEREKALQEVKILRGLLPICASCKRIKDDNGYWTQIEGYIKNHSEAEFTHGLCPECAERLYPEIFRPKGP